ncbi:MAG: fructosamine kinase family protein [Micromonosporaceae bacterium]|nr:fructosamine kinase family protein [Micromonosporaceae bacterium]
MDLAYLREHPHLVPTMLTHQRIRETPVPGGSICAATRLTLDDGTSLFAKAWRGPGPVPEHFFATEAAGLTWLREAGAAAVPEVVAALPELLVLEWVDPAPATPAAAHRFGRELAALHRTGATGFGAPWPGFIGALPMPNDASPGPWPGWFAQRRLAPYLKISADRGALSATDVTAVERLLSDIDRYAGPAVDEAPTRIHGDLWPGNLLWSTGRVWLVDPAAHGGHRETDLANLALFGGAPHLDRILAGYQEVYPLAAGWQRRVPLHQLHLLLVHTALFGSSYRSAVMSAVRATVDQ